MKKHHNIQVASYETACKILGSRVVDVTIGNFVRAILRKDGTQAVKYLMDLQFEARESKADIFSFTLVSQGSKKDFLVANAIYDIMVQLGYIPAEIIMRIQKARQVV